MNLQPHELSRKRRFGILAICCMSLLIVGIDVTIVNVALPSIGHDFDASVSGLQWTIDAYTLVLASFVMLSGSTGDRLGRKQTFMVGLALFSLGSLLCSLAPNLTALVIFRMIQALGGSMLNPVAMSIITNVFTNPKERAQAVSVWMGTLGLAMALGPVVGGALVGSAGWRSVFWISVPVGVAAILLTWRFTPNSKAPKPRSVDVGGQMYIIVFLATLTYGIIEAPKHGFLSPIILTSFGLTVLAFIALFLRERRQTEPLIDLRFFKSIPFSGAATVAIASFATLAGFLFLNTLYLQQVRGFSPLRAGLYTLPMAATTMIFSLSGRFTGKYVVRVQLLVAGASITTACLMLTSIGAHTATWYLFVAYAFFGIGFGTVNSPITNSAVSGMPRAQAGVAAAIASASRQVGATLGVAVVGATVASAIGTSSTHLRVASATHTGWWILAVCGFLVFSLGIVITTKWARRSADRIAELLNPEFLEKDVAK